MTRERQILEDALFRLREYSGLPVKIDNVEVTIITLTIGKTQFLATVRTAISIGNKSSIASILDHISKDRRKPVLIIAGYIPSEIAQEYVANGVNYLDIAGNCSIKYKDLILQIEGKKREKIATINQARAFQEAGVKIIFHLLTNPENIQLTYRGLAQLADVSLGSVSSVMQELIELNFILVTNKGKTLKNTGLLLDRWVTAYHDVLRPRLFLKRMRFTRPDQLHSWEMFSLQDAEGIALWGGEPAAAELTSYISPEKFTIYTNVSWQNLMQDFHLLPDENGSIEVFNMFWKEEAKFREKYIVPPLLIYADLMADNISRNIETAKIILENELSYIKPAIQ
ncbi:MAG TPA: type IV toxin-antitoxin system AbiEi family antitoxin [Puia sp.]|nr:type IV toxin-antitoxin system AbiEi family antitoxin [Puia sp.]